MDQEQKKRMKRLKEETVETIGSAPMITLQGQPFLDADGQKVYLRHENLDEEEGKRKPHEKTKG